MQTMRFDVHGMTCGGCTGSIQRALYQLDGVGAVDVTLIPQTRARRGNFVKVGCFE